MRASLSTYNSARGFSRGRHPELLSVSNAELSARETLPFLDASASRSVEAALFFLPPLGGRVAFLLLLVVLGGGGGVGSASSDVTSEVPLRRRPPLPAWPFFLASFSGAW